MEKSAAGRPVRTRKDDLGFAQVNLRPARACQAGATWRWIMRWCRNRRARGAVASEIGGAGRGAGRVGRLCHRQPRCQGVFRLQPIDIERDQSLAQAIGASARDHRVAATRSAATHRTDEDLRHIGVSFWAWNMPSPATRLGDGRTCLSSGHRRGDAQPHFVSLCSHLITGARRIIHRAPTRTT